MLKYFNYCSIIHILWSLLSVSTKKCPNTQLLFDASDVSGHRQLQFPHLIVNDMR